MTLVGGGAAMLLAAVACQPADPTALPLGDGHVSSQPEVGSVWSCQTSFGGGGAFAVGEWIGDDGTFDATAKAEVDGEVTWPSSYTIELDGDVRRLVGNGLPDHPTGIYPVRSSGEA